MPKPVVLKRLYPVIGEFIVQYAIVQGIMRTLLLELLNVRGKGATTLVYGMSDEVVVKKIKIALRAYGRFYSKFLPALKNLDDVTTFRNQIVHWVPFTNPSKTTIEAFIDANRDYKNPTQPQITCTPAHIRGLTRWLRLFEWDLLTALMAIDQRLKFDEEDYQTIQQHLPNVPKSTYPQKPT